MAFSCHGGEALLAGESHVMFFFTLANAPVNGAAAAHFPAASSARSRWARWSASRGWCCSPPSSRWRRSTRPRAAHRDARSGHALVQRRYRPHGRALCRRRGRRRRRLQSEAKFGALVLGLDGRDRFGVCTGGSAAARRPAISAMGHKQAAFFRASSCKIRAGDNAFAAHPAQAETPELPDPASLRAVVITFPMTLSRSSPSKVLRRVPSVVAFSSTSVYQVDVPGLHGRTGPRPRRSRRRRARRPGVHAGARRRRPHQAAGIFGEPRRASAEEASLTPVEPMLYSRRRRAERQGRQVGVAGDELTRDIIEATGRARRQHLPRPGCPRTARHRRAFLHEGGSRALCLGSCIVNPRQGAERLGERVSERARARASELAADEAGGDDGSQVVEGVTGDAGCCADVLVVVVAVLRARARRAAAGERAATKEGALASSKINDDFTKASEDILAAGRGVELRPPPRRVFGFAMIQLCFVERAARRQEHAKRRPRAGTARGPPLGLVLRRRQRGEVNARLLGRLRRSFELCSPRPGRRDGRPRPALLFA